MRKLNKKINLRSSWRIPLLSTCAVLCSVSTAAMAKSVATDSGCPAWNPNFTYSTTYYPVEYNGQVYVNHWYTSGDVPDATNSGNPWHYPDAGQDPATLCKNIPAPGTATIESWETAAKYDSGAAVPLVWDMYSGNTSANWQVLDNDISIYKANTVSSTAVSTSLKLADGQHVLKVKLCSTDSDASCSISAAVNVTVGGGNPPPAVLPTPIIDTPADGAKTTSQQIAVSWHPDSSTAAPANTYWNVETTASNGKSVFTNNINQINSTNQTTVTVNSTGDYILQVNVCQDVNTCKFSSVTVHVTSPAVTPATPTITQPTAGTVNNPVTLTWNAPPDNANDNLWEVLDNANTTPIYTSNSLTTNANGESGSGSLTLSTGNHSLQVALCNDAGCGALSNAVNISIPNPPPTTDKLIMGYYSNWTVYNNLLRHGGTQATDPYGLSGIKYQPVAYGPIYTMTTNNDSAAQIENLDIIVYAFAEVYPSYSVTYNSISKIWTPFTDPVHRNTPYYSPENIGKIFLSDPWSDLFASEYTNTQNTASQGLCDENNLFSSSDLYTHEICLGGYETVINGKTGEPTDYTSYFPDQNIVSGTPMTKQTYDANAGYWSLSGNLNQFSKVKKQKSTTPLKKLISIGGWYHEDSFEAGAFVNHANFIGSLEQLIDHFGLDGVDLDYEPGFYNTDGFTADNADKFLSLVEDLRSALDKKYGPNTKLITMAVSANPATLNVIGTRWPQIAANVNYISLMGYDYHGAFDAQGNNGKATTDSDSNLFKDPQEPASVEGGTYDDDTSVKALVSLGVPRNQILLGIPSYARAVQGVQSKANNGLYQTYNNDSFLGDMDSADDSRHPPQGQQSYYGLLHQETNISNGQVVKAWVDNNFIAYALTNAPGQIAGDYAAWMFNGSDSSVTSYTFASYDTPTVINTKANYVQQNQLAGMMMWELSSDTTPAETSTSLLCSMAKVLHSNLGCITSSN